MNKISNNLLKWLVVVFAIVTGIFTFATSDKAVSNQHQKVTQQLFEQAATEFHVPLNVLLSVSYNETRWEQHEGERSTTGGYGLMHLVDDDSLPMQSLKGDVTNNLVSTSNIHQTLKKAATLSHSTIAEVKNTQKQNIRAGAALLASYENETNKHLSKNPAEWYGAVAKYSGASTKELAENFANDVFATINKGKVRTTSTGQYVSLKASNITPDKETIKPLHLKETKKQTKDCPKTVTCLYQPALYQQFSSTGDYGNYDIANRPTDGQKIQYIIIHDIEGSYEEGINTFLRPSYVSAHYVVRSSDGQITQMLRPKDIAWQAGNWYVNAHSIGIEHEGTAIDGGTWYSEQMYHASAKLVKYLSVRYNIPLDRAHILGHDNVPGLDVTHQKGMHWDPATYWDWSHYFDLLGAPFQKEGKKNKNTHIVTISPQFKTNQPKITYQGTTLLSQPSDFVYLYQSPNFDSNLIGDTLLHPTGNGTTEINDWGDKAVAGQTFYEVDKTKNWTAIYYGGQKAWFYNPKQKNSVNGSGLVITPVKGKTSIPVYGAAYPETQAYERNHITPVTLTPIYTMKKGQKYIATTPVNGDYYYAKLYQNPASYKVVKGKEMYYQIQYNHRIAFVKNSDVTLTH